MAGEATIGDFSVVIRAFKKAYDKTVDTGYSETDKVEILAGLVSIYARLSKTDLAVETHSIFPKCQVHLWACTCYELVCKGDWKSAKLARCQYIVREGTKFTYPLKPLCKKTALKENPWILDLLQYFLECGADRHTISLKKGDTYLHAVTRMTLIVGMDEPKLLNYVLNKFCLSSTSTDQFAVDSNGNTVLHMTTSVKGCDNELRRDILAILLKHNSDPWITNTRGQLPIDSLSEEDVQCQEVLRKAMKRRDQTKNVINRLTEKGDQKLKSGNAEDAVDCYTKAINLMPMMGPDKTSNHEKAVLFGKRAEGFLTIKRFKEARDDALISIGNDGNGYEGYVKVGKTHVGEGDFQKAIGAFVKAYGNTLNTECDEKRKIEILLELASTCAQLSENDLNVKRKLSNFPKGQGHLWACACYELVSRGDWKSATVAYFQHVVGKGEVSDFTYPLTPFCKKKKLKENPWVLDLLLYLLKCGADRHTISQEEGDTYLHAVTKMTLIVGMVKPKETKLLKYVLKDYCPSLKRDEQLCFDKYGNTLLHVVNRKRGVSSELRRKIINLLLAHNVDLFEKDHHGQLPSDSLSEEDIQCREDLLIAMRGKEKATEHKSEEKKSSPLQIQQRPDASQLACSTVKSQTDCGHCSQLYSKGQNYFHAKIIEKGHECLTELICQEHSGPEHDKIVNKAITAIVSMLSKTSNPAIPRCLTSISEEVYLQVIAGLAQQNRWRQLNNVVRIYRTMQGSDKLKSFAHDMMVLPLIQDPNLKTYEDEKLQIINKLLDSGASMGTDGGQTSLSMAIAEEHFKVVGGLIIRGADTSTLTLRKGDTPLHAALTIVIMMKTDVSLLRFMLKQYSDTPEMYPHLDPEKQDINGDCLFHIVAKAKCVSHTVKVTEILCENKISSKYYNKDGKLPTSYLPKNDRRRQLITLAEDVEPRRVSVYKPRLPQNESSLINPEDVIRTDVTELCYIREGDKVSMREQRKRTISDMIRNLPDNLRNNSDEDEKMKNVHMDENDPLEEEAKAENNVKDLEVDDAMVEDDDDEDEIQEEAVDFHIDVQIFDNLEWEVECTTDFWKTLRSKRVEMSLKKRIIHKIQLLASGEWLPHLCKKQKNVPPDLNLFEAKFSKGSRILWELAVAFSPRCSERANEIDQGVVPKRVRDHRIYSEVIRVWDVVFDHDKRKRNVQKIIKSHQRGKRCIVQKKLCVYKSSESRVRSGDRRMYPNLYQEEDAIVEEVQKHHKEFYPLASVNESEFHILKFYSFSSVLVSQVLQNIEDKVDFPFKVTDLEHEIINLVVKAPILLLGRSGTGKTTCCMYRLWSEFHRYWSKAREADAPLLPRCVEFVYEKRDRDQVVSEKGSVEVFGDGKTEECNEDEYASGAQYDHIHQIFITKNGVLCNEVQKNFRELRHADDLMELHVKYEMDDIPNRLQDINDFGYPLFVTSKHLLLMLDASIGPPYFFDRKDDGGLKLDIEGWSDADGPLRSLHLLDENLGMDDKADHKKTYNDKGRKHTADKDKSDQRREITYAVFVEEVWPRIKTSQMNYHPSLVWMEIMSFIKGSYEALTKASGFLLRDEYDELGKKRAPNFVGNRADLYELFTRYKLFKERNQFYDETDLVHNIFNRLQHLDSRPWVVHQVYVDETQDFTQAELYLLITLCQNPNDMFLTGDTAQSIMRGISFRFCDLRSLFFHAKQSMGKTSVIEVPEKVYQLSQNYRSHAGILGLASGVLELLFEFFPESFDRLQPEQGLFHGPLPNLLESCSFSNLAVLLQGNKRKTSHIEFGAHQAILVVNESAKEAIPKELRLGIVLTIYEAKGLEFDDVLLYNFFKDSQANKEWRVATDFLERLSASQHEESAQSFVNQENLHMIDQDILSQKGRPRPLNFDPNLHNILNSELKHLYTALTRARVNVWIFDEDMEKRAPMFEYFKARKLVKSLKISDINETSMSETVFAVKSSSADWIRRGEDFMRHSLYEAAAKCFSIGEDLNREKVALAHKQALIASKTTENKRQMQDEFLFAAQLYMECNMPRKAVMCLQNADEGELVAQLNEILGQDDEKGQQDTFASNANLVQKEQF